MRTNWFQYLIYDLFPDVDSVVYRRSLHDTMPDKVVEWGAADGGMLGAIILCKLCDGKWKNCTSCDGVGKLFVPYFQSPPVEPQTTETKSRIANATGKVPPIGIPQVRTPFSK